MDLLTEPVLGVKPSYLMTVDELDTVTILCTEIY